MDASTTPPHTAPPASGWRGPRAAARASPCRSLQIPVLSAQAATTCGKAGSGAPICHTRGVRRQSCLLSSRSGRGRSSVALVFDLDHLKRRGMNRHLDPAPLGIAAVDLVAAVVDLDPAHRPAVRFGQPRQRPPAAASRPSARSSRRRPSAAAAGRTASKARIVSVFLMGQTPRCGHLEQPCAAKLTGS